MAVIKLICSFRINETEIVYVELDLEEVLIKQAVGEILGALSRVVNPPEWMRTTPIVPPPPPEPKRERCEALAISSHENTRCIFEDDHLGAHMDESGNSFDV